MRRSKKSHPGRNISQRGLVAGNNRGIWVNAQGNRFVNERLSPKFTFEAVLRQKPASYWMIFDEKMKRNFFVSGSDWGDFSTIQRVIFDNPEVMKSAATIETLATSAGLPVETLVETVRRYNELVAKVEGAPIRYCVLFYTYLG